MLIGLGDLGGVTLELLAQQDYLGRIAAASRDAERGVAHCNFARMSAIAQGHVPDICFMQRNELQNSYHDCVSIPIAMGSASSEADPSRAIPQG
jgi:hypothetical protein